MKGSLSLFLGSTPLFSYLGLLLSSLHRLILGSCLFPAKFCLGLLFFQAVSSIQPSGDGVAGQCLKRLLFSAASAEGFSAKMPLFPQRCLFLACRFAAPLFLQVAASTHFHRFFNDPAQRQMLTMFGDVCSHAPLNARRTRKSWRPFSKSSTNPATVGALKLIDMLDFRSATKEIPDTVGVFTRVADHRPSLHLVQTQCRMHAAVLMG